MMKKTLTLLLGLLIALPVFAANPQVEMQTSQGNITLELYPDRAPKTVANFLQYVKEGQYNGTIFHRVIDGFMIQGGGFTPQMSEKPTREPIVNEANNGLKNEVGTIAMARTSDPNSASAQFFININDNVPLNFRAATLQGYGYAVFGRVTHGMDVVNKIAKAKTDNQGMFQDVPVTPIVIKSVTVVH